MQINRSVSVLNLLRTSLLAVAVALLTLLVPLASVAGAADDDQAGQRNPTKGTVDTKGDEGAAEPLDLLGGLLFDRPIIQGDFADPFGLALGEEVFLYATNTIQANIPVMKLPKNATTTARYLGDALPTLPSWTAKGKQWAPSVWARPDGTYVMHYTTPASTTSSKMCISVATADNPAGPFTDNSTAPMICPLDQGGAIDPSIFIDDDVPYLLWKSDGNCCSLPTNIYSQQLTADGLDVADPPTKLITATQPWQGDLVEGPAMIRQGDRFFLFYSANNWNSTHYAIGIATCESIKGTCRATTDSPWMDSQSFDEGPGGEEFMKVSNGEIWMVHHGWLPHEAGTPDGQRRLYLDRISLHGGDDLPTRSGSLAVIEKLAGYGFALVILVGLVVGAFVAVRRVRRSDDGSSPQAQPS